MLARTPTAIKKRNYRRRQREGCIVLRIEVNEAQIAEALLLAGRLTADAALARSELERAAAGVLSEWAARWLQHKR